MVLIKGTEGYGYKYTDMAQIQTALDKLGIEYQQKVDTDTLTQKDYIYTRDRKTGTTEWSEWVRGAKVIEATLPNGKMNPAQQYGSGLSYARRYSLMLYFGIATADDDAECFTKEIKKETAPTNTTKQNVAKAIENHEGSLKSTQAQQDLITELIQKNNITPEEQKIDMANFGNKIFRDLTKIEADRLIKAYSEYSKVREKRAQNGRA